MPPQTRCRSREIYEMEAGLARLEASASGQVRQQRRDSPHPPRTG